MKRRSSTRQRKSRNDKIVGALLIIGALVIASTPFIAYYLAH